MNHCNGCTMCCKVFAMKEFNKPENVWCTHCNPTKGCKIYSERPQTCIDYECLWLQSQQLQDGRMGDALKPSRCKIVFDTNINGTMLVAHIDPSYPDSINRPEVVHFIQDIARRGIIVYVRCGTKRYIYGHRDDDELLKQIEAAVAMTDKADWIELQ